MVDRPVRAGFVVPVSLEKWSWNLAVLLNQYLSFPSQLGASRSLDGRQDRNCTPSSNVCS
jgi:hypothetical protein